MNSHRPVLAVVLFLGVPLLAGCQAFGINEQYSAASPDVPAMEKSWDSMRIPELVPSDVVDISLGYNTIEEGQIMAFSSEEGITAGYCVEGEVDGESAYEPAWWSTDGVADEGWTCGDWSVVLDDERYLVWN